jgi:hypothetical protein
MYPILSLCETWDSHGDEDSVAVFWVMTLCNDDVGYQHFGGPYYLKMKAAWISKTMVFCHITRRCYNPEDHKMTHNVLVLQCCSCLLMIHNHPWTCDVTQSPWIVTLFAIHCLKPLKCFHCWFSNDWQNFMLACCSRKSIFSTSKPLH